MARKLRGDEKVMSSSSSKDLAGCCCCLGTSGPPLLLLLPPPLLLSRFGKTGLGAIGGGGACPTKPGGSPSDSEPESLVSSRCMVWTRLLLPFPFALSFPLPLELAVALTVGETGQLSLQSRTETGSSPRLEKRVMRGAEEEEAGGGGGGANPYIESLLGGRPFMVQFPLYAASSGVYGGPRSWLRSDVGSTETASERASEGASSAGGWAGLAACSLHLDLSLYAFTRRARVCRSEEKVGEAGGNDEEPPLERFELPRQHDHSPLLITLSPGSIDTRTESAKLQYCGAHAVPLAALLFGRTHAHPDPIPSSTRT
jgi:hypothetical protein